MADEKVRDDERDEEKKKSDAADAKAREEQGDADDGEGDEDEPEAEAKAEASSSEAKAEEKADEKADEKKADAKSAVKPATVAAKPGARPGARMVPKRGAARKAVPQKKGSGSLGKSMILFFVIVAGLGLGFYFLGRNNEDGGPKNVNWKVGQVVDVEVTLVKTDATDLACASADEVDGRHCAFEAENKPWTKGPNNDDSKLLKPYTTTDHVQFVAAGLWSQPALAPDKLPVSRFNAKCKLKVEGKVKKPSVRWSASENKWYPNGDWNAGVLSDCKVTP